MNDPIFRANEAKRLLGELAPYLAELEGDSFERLMATKWWEDAEHRNVNHYLDEINVIRAIRSRLESVITEGRIADAREERTSVLVTNKFTGSKRR